MFPRLSTLRAPWLQRTQSTQPFQIHRPSVESVGNHPRVGHTLQSFSLAGSLRLHIANEDALSAIEVDFRRSRHILNHSHAGVNYMW